MISSSSDCRIHGAVLGALVSDSLSLGSHYEYDAIKIKQAYGGKSIDTLLAPGERMGGSTHGVGWGQRNYHPGTFFCPCAFFPFYPRPPPTASGSLQMPKVQTQCSHESVRRFANDDVDFSQANLPVETLTTGLETSSSSSISLAREKVRDIIRRWLLVAGVLFVAMFLQNGNHSHSLESDLVFRRQGILNRLVRSRLLARSVQGLAAGQVQGVRFVARHHGEDCLVKHGKGCAA